MPERHSQVSFPQPNSPQPDLMVWSKPLLSYCSTSIKSVDREAGVDFVLSSTPLNRCTTAVSEPKESFSTYTCMHLHTHIQNIYLLSSTLWSYCMSFSSSEENTLFLQGLCVCVCFPQKKALWQRQKLNPCGFLGLSLTRKQVEV